MLRMIIADDEKIIRESLKNLIDWKALGVEIIGICQNGIEAYERIIDDYPDLVMTDIKMPGLNGLELIEKTSTLEYPVEFILLSGYSEFEFAKQAMKFGVQHYLLKPCNQAQIIEAVKSAGSRSRQKKALHAVKIEQRSVSGMLSESLIKNLLYEILNPNCSMDSIIARYENYIDCFSQEYQLFCISARADEDIRKYLSPIEGCLQTFAPALAFGIYDTRMLVIFLQDFYGDYSLLEQKLQATITDALTFHQMRYQNLATLLQELHNCFIDSETVYLLDKKEPLPLYNHLALFQNAEAFIKELSMMKNQKDFYRRLDILFRQIGDPELLKAVFGYLWTQYMAVRSVSRSGTLAVEMVARIHTVEDLQAIKADLVKALSDAFYEMQQGDSYKNFIEKTIDYIHENLDNPDLSLKWIAENVLYMNVDYLSRQFVKQMGCKFSYYLNQLRIDKAKALLQTNPTDKIYWVAEQVGCGNNPQYFGQIFKKHLGMTPTEYIKTLMAD